MTGQDGTADQTGPGGPQAGDTRRHSGLVAAGILLSRLSGLVRTRAFGHFFGTSAVADAFTTAFKIPNLLQNLLGEGVLSASFIPVYSRLLAEDRDEEAGRVAGAVAGLLTATAGGLVVIGIVFARPLAGVLAAGFPPAKFDLTVDLMRIIFPGVGLLVLSAWCLGVLNSHRRFFLSYVAPVLWNGAQIAVLVGLGLTVYAEGFVGEPDVSAQVGLVTWLAWGTVAGGLLQFLMQLPAVLRIAKGLRVSLDVQRRGVRHTISAFGPVVAGRGVVQLSAYVDITLASFLAAGAVAVLQNYAQLLYVLPISLFGMSIAAAELPELSRAPRDALEGLVDRLDEGLQRIAVLVVPTAVGYLVLGDLIIGTLFQSGEFGRLASVQVWIVLGGYSIGLLATTSSRLLQSALYGIGDPRTPAKVAALRVALSALLGVGLMFQFDRVEVIAGGITLVGDLPAFGPLPAAVRSPEGVEQLHRLGALGLSLAAGLASWVEYRLLARVVERRIGSVRLGGGRLGAIVAAAAAAGVVGLAARIVVAPLHPLLAGPLAVAIVGVVYLAVAHRLGVTEIRDTAAAFRRRLGR